MKRIIVTLTQMHFEVCTYIHVYVYLTGISCKYINVCVVNDSESETLPSV